VDHTHSPPLFLPSPSLRLRGKWWSACRWAGWWWWWVLINHRCHVCHIPVNKMLFAEINKIYLPQRLVRTGPDQSLCGPGIFEMAKDHGPDCGCSPVRSCNFRSWVVRVRSSPGLFPVLWPDFQTLIGYLNPMDSGPCVRRLCNNSNTAKMSELGIWTH